MARRKGRPSKNNYFTQDTEDAIVLYNNTEDEKQRSIIYEEKIHYAFNRLVEAITHRFKFYHTEVDYLEQLHHEVETFLHSKIHLFDPSRGAKAYSYFGTIAKRYLIIQNTKNYKKKIATTVVEVVDNDEKHSYGMRSPEDKTDLQIFLEAYILFCEEHLFEIFTNPVEAKIADSILELFKKRESLDIINKKALYIYIREMVPDINTPRITKVANKLKDIFKLNYNYYLEFGDIDFDLP
jgi:hypothetical protein